MAAHDNYDIVIDTLSQAQPTVTMSSFVLVDAGSDLFFSSQSDEQKEK